MDYTTIALIVVSTMLIGLFAILYMRTYAKSEVLAMLSDEIAKAETYFSETGKGDEKKKMVYDAVRSKLPSSVGLFVTDDLLDKLIETTLIGMQQIIKMNK